MNNAQQAALDKFEEAAETLSARGLMLAGVDSDLYVFSIRQYNQVKKQLAKERGVPETYISMPEIISHMNFEDMTVTTVDCDYLDSGGF